MSAGLFHQSLKKPGALDYKGKKEKGNFCGSRGGVEFGAFFQRGLEIANQLGVAP
jgi:hypothetical protein